MNRKRLSARNFKHEMKTNTVANKSCFVLHGPGPSRWAFMLRSHDQPKTICLFSATH